MRVPEIRFRPRSAIEHRGRLAKALEPIYDVEMVGLGSQTEPHLSSAAEDHCFDWVDGLRLVVARWSGSTLGRGIHLVASVHRRSRLGKKIAWGELGRKDYCGMVCQRWAEVSNDRRPVRFVEWLNGGIPHFFVADSGVGQPKVLNQASDV